MDERRARLSWMSVVSTLLLILIAGVSPAYANDAELIPRIDASLAKAGRFFIESQSEDGAWRSRTYGPMRDGMSLTPHVMTALWFISKDGSVERDAFRRGNAYLDGMVEIDDDGNVTTVLSFPIYSAAAASWVSILGSKTEQRLAMQEAWLSLVRQHHMNGSRGWTHADKSFGGWGYSVHRPFKPRDGQPTPGIMEANLSATLYGLGALKMGKIASSDPAYSEILSFIEKCQNFSDDEAAADPRFDDGGFFFMPDDDARNKAGVAGVDRHGTKRFHTYGSMTADGLRGLLQCGLPADHPRVVAARRWLERNFSPTDNPGVFEPDREILRNATYYYYCWSASHALMHLRRCTFETGTSQVVWPAALARELLRRQASDGAWRNEFTDTKEDDPLVSTPHAVAALVLCREMLSNRTPITH